MNAQSNDDLRLAKDTDVELQYTSIQYNQKYIDDFIPLSYNA